MKHRARRILIVDDHATLRETVALFINMQSGLRVCGEAGGSVDGLDAARRLRPDLALIDLLLRNEEDGLSLVKKLRDRFPRMGILVLSFHKELEYIRRAFSLGANGYTAKADPADDLIHALRVVLNGGMYLPSGISLSLLESTRRSNRAAKDIDQSLSRRELQVLKLIGDGLGPSEIAKN